KDVKFDHARSRFALLGRHQAIACEDCHRTQIYKDTPLACDKCHADIVHRGRLGTTAQCQTCHNAETWKRWKYDHGRQAHYPLTGAHAKLVCETCHAIPGGALKLPVACVSCHADRVHQGRLGASPKCEACHDSSTWKRWRFDHGFKAHYPLTGAHARLECETCHAAKNPPNLKLPRDCATCHRRDDPHANNFGPVCDKCHTTSNWRQVNIRN
ncbi:MAG: cytochrome C, partial [Hyphomicrobiales bacterium]|nr:cytochrome C [Hyphomicrobiales bacterium]